MVGPSLTAAVHTACVPGWAWAEVGWLETTGDVPWLVGGTVPCADPEAPPVPAWLVVFPGPLSFLGVTEEEGGGPKIGWAPVLRLGRVVGDGGLGVSPSYHRPATIRGIGRGT